MISIKFDKRGLDQLIRKIERIADGVDTEFGGARESVVSMKISPDSKGMVDRECPRCGAGFKVDAAHCDAHAGDLVCPYVGHTAPPDQWVARKHVDAVRAIGEQFMRDRLEAILSGREGPLTPGVERVDHDPSGRRRIVAVAAAALEPLRQERTCGRCSCRFSFLGAAFFCPLCGDTSAEANFQQNLEGIRRSIQNIPAVSRVLDADDAANHARTTLENGIEDAVTALQVVAESLYIQKTGKEAPHNAFQRVIGSGTTGDSLWTAATGHSYEFHLGAEALGRLSLFVNRRHVIGHRDGFVDSKYKTKTEDAAFEAGERLRVTSRDVLEFVGIVERLVAGMRSDL